MKFWLFFYAAVVAAAGISWAEDVIVAVGSRLELVSEGHQPGQVPLGSFNATALVALTYDSVSRRVFFADIKHHNASVFAVKLNETEADVDVEEIVQKGGEESVEGLTFDTVDQTLYWTDGSQRLIRRVNITSQLENENENASAKMVHFLGNDKPRSLVADPCTRMLYWINWNRDVSTIERSFLNGSHRGIVFKEDLLMPHGLSLDVQQQRLYWVNNLHYSAFRIESGRVDGTDRQLIYKGVGQFVFGLALGQDHLYWTDWENQMLWSLAVAKAAEGKPKSLGHFAQKPMGVAVLRDVQLHCSGVQLDLKVLEAQEGLLAQEIEEEEMGKIPSLHFNHLVLDVCYNFCLNGGNCTVVDDQPVCSCPEGSQGDRCQLEPDSHPQHCSSSGLSRDDRGNVLLIALFAVSSVCLLLIAGLVFLVIRVKRLSRRPKLRRRFIGAPKKKAAAPAPVMDIENCCNMNLCETPCFEPPTRTPSSSPSKRQTEDKQNLLTDEDIADA